MKLFNKPRNEPLINQGSSTDVRRTDSRSKLRGAELKKALRQARRAQRDRSFSRGVSMLRDAESRETTESIARNFEASRERNRERYRELFAGILR